MPFQRKLCTESQLDKKVELLKTLQTPLHYSSHINLISALLQRCIIAKNLSLGRELHCLIVQQGLEANTFLGSYFIRLFSVCGKLVEADLIFNKLHDPNVFAWSEIISAQANDGEHGLAIGLFERMVHACTQPDGHVFVAVLRACAAVEALLLGQQIHFLAVESALDSDSYVRNAFINMYVKCSALEDAQSIFDRCSCRDVVSWSTIIAGYAQRMHCHEAVVLFDAMHREGIEANNVAWNAIICGYAQNGDCHEALDFFVRMLQQKREPDNFTYVSVLNACSNLAAIEQGRLIHIDIIESCYGSDMYIRSILIDMYAKNGSLDDARRVFYGHQVQNAVTWTAMMAAYALHSNYRMVLHYFRGMQEKGLIPNDVTFLCLLSSCSQMGLVEDAFQHLHAMKEQYGITPTAEHYNCLLDLLGRAGLFNEVSETLACTKGAFNCVAQTSLLNSCRLFSNVDLGRKCLDHMVSEDSW
ncbi:hypothetical protein GOP47_0026883 [Adiantum capillus-veneris]|nr:hypothetical protein GOP47_0026883 [Adiantum capillus-veneris]